MSDLELDDLLNRQKEFFNSKITLNPSTIGTHVGPGAIALAFFKKNK